MFYVRRRLSVTRVVAWLRAAITAEWHGPPDLSRSLTMEWRLIVARWVGIVAVAPALPLLHLSPTRLVVACAILLAAVAYNIAIRLWLPRRPQWFASGYFTTVCDSLASIAMVLVGGGFANSIGYVLFTISISVAMRYGYGPSMAMTGLFIGCDLLESMAFGQTPDAPFALRSGFLLITAFLASYLRRLAEKAEKALHDRLVELQRLYSDLAIATRSCSVSTRPRRTSWPTSRTSCAHR